jgi:hypothetical protein
MWKKPMSDRTKQLANAGTEMALRGNLLPAGIRRDVADLNRLFLDCALDEALQPDPWFCLPQQAVIRLMLANPAARERVVQCPFTLFDLCLPQAGDRSDWQPPAVADAQPFDARLRAQADARRSFGLVALGAARRFAEGVPLSPRIAFGVGAAAEARLSGLSPSESFGVAAWPGLIRPRWQRHERYWCMLAAAATGTDAQVLRWAFATAMCLPAQGERAIASADGPLSRRRVRAGPVRP